MLFNLVHFNEKSYQKQKGPGTSGQLVFMLPNRFWKIALLVIYYLNKFDGVIKSVFLSYFNNYISKFMQANSWHHKWFHFHLFFESGKCGKEGKKLNKFEYLENEKNFLDEIKSIFHSFWRAIIWWTNKNLIKNSRRKL